MFPGTQQILGESSGVGNLTQALITHVLLLLSRTRLFDLIRNYVIFTCQAAVAVS